MWNALNDTTWLRAYAAASDASINALAFKLEGGCLAILNPPTRATDDDFGGLRELGRVTALIAPNGDHSLGLDLWQGRFPSAMIHAPALAAPWLGGDSGRAIRALEDLALPVGVTLQELPGARRGATLFVDRRCPRTIVYVDEILTNPQETPHAFFAGLFFRASGRKLGLQVNPTYERLDRRRGRDLARALLAHLSSIPYPVAMIPAHGAIVQESDAIIAACELLAALVSEDRPSGAGATPPARP